MREYAYQRRGTSRCPGVGQEIEGEGKCGQESLLCFPWGEGNDKAGQVGLGLASLNNFIVSGAQGCP